MGRDLHVELAGMESYPVPYLDRGILYDLLEQGEIDLDECLEEDDIRLLQDIPFGDRTDAALYDPRVLQRIFTRIYDYIRTYEDILPLIHYLRDLNDPRERDFGGAITFDFKRAGRKIAGWMSGYEHNTGLDFELEHREDIFVRVWGPTRDSRPHDCWVRVQPLLIIEGMEIAVVSSSLMDMHGDRLQEAIAFCKTAFGMDKKIRLWIS